MMMWVPLNTLSFGNVDWNYWFISDDSPRENDYLTILNLSCNISSWSFSINFLQECYLKWIYGSWYSHYRSSYIRRFITEQLLHRIEFKYFRCSKKCKLYVFWILLVSTPRFQENPSQTNWIVHMSWETRCVLWMHKPSSGLRGIRNLWSNRSSSWKY